MFERNTFEGMQERLHDLGTTLWKLTDMVAKNSTPATMANMLCTIKQVCADARAEAEAFHQYCREKGISE